MDISSIASYVTPKEFQLLFNGILQIVKVQIQENTFQVVANLSDYEILIEKLKSINADLEVNDLQNIIQSLELIVKKAAVENWSSDTFNEFLTGNNFPEEYLTLVLALWTRESTKIHQKLVELSTFNNILSNNILWRVDMNAMSKQSTDLNEVVAHFELNLKHFPRQEKKKSEEETVKFEMNRTEIQSMLQQFQQIQTCYQQLMQTKTATN